MFQAKTDRLSTYLPTYLPYSPVLEAKLDNRESEMDIH